MGGCVLKQTDSKRFKHHFFAARGWPLRFLFSTDSQVGSTALLVAGPWPRGAALVLGHGSGGSLEGHWGELKTWCFVLVLVEKNIGF